jgi:plasmid stability protein
MITTDRNEFIGAHVTPEVKQALRKRAADEKKSMSELVHETLERQLKPEATAEPETETTNA